MNARNRDLLYLALDYIADTPRRKSLYPLWKLFLELEEISVHKFEPTFKTYERTFKTYEPTFKTYERRILLGTGTISFKSRNNFP